MHTSGFMSPLPMYRLFRICPILIAAMLTQVAFAYAGESAAELIQKGDVFYAKLQPTEALCCYLPAEKLDPNNARLLVKIARQYRHQASDAPEKAEKVRLGTIAVNYANRAVALAPNDPEAQLAVAISYGRILPYQATKTQLANSQVIKKATDRVIALDPQNDLAWQVLGRWYFNVADVSTFKRAVGDMIYGNLPKASFDDAKRCFERAIALNPNRLMHYIELGRTYAKKDQPELARKFIERGLAMPNTEKDDPETKNLGRQILKKLP